MKQKILCLFFSLCFFSLNCEVLEFVFTNTTVYKGGPGLDGAAQYEMPAGDNYYSGWVWFPAGFKIPSGQTCGLNVFSPVGGEIDFSVDGTLTITGDLNLASNASIKNVNGIVDGNGYAIIFSDELTLNSELLFTNDTIIDGNNNPLILDTNGVLKIANNMTLTLQNMVLKNLSGTQINMVGAGSKLVLDNVTIWLDGDYNFLDGSLFVYNDVKICGSSHAFNYKSDEKSYIKEQSQLIIDHGVRLTYEPTSDLSDDLLVMVDNTSHLYLNGATLYSDDIGLKLSTGTVIFDGLVTLSAEGQDSTDSISFESDSTTVLLPGANVQIYGAIQVA